MNRLSQSGKAKRCPQPTVLGARPIDLAPKKRAHLFGGLEKLVNTGDSQQQYQSLSKQWPSFWPEGPESPTAWLPEEHSNFRNYRDKLRQLWSGSLNEQQQLGTVAYLLGLISSEEADSLFFTGPEALAELWFRRPNKPSAGSAVSTLHSIVLPLWGSIDVRFFARGDFEAALWALFRESWRARICGQCQRYFIADKAAQAYCSTRCYGEAKRGQRLAWWNKTGKIRRAQEGSSSRKKHPRKRRRRQD